MSFSINTNAGSLGALHVLQNTLRQMQGNQTAINTGLKVATAKDNAAIFAIAQNLRADMAGHNALDHARSRDHGLLDITAVSIEMIQDQIMEMKELAVAAADPGISDQHRLALSESYRAHRDNIDRIASQASFQGLNLIDSRESNFLTYGPNPAVIGSDAQTAYEPQPGQTVDLTFGFSGGGLQSEDIRGTVSYYYRWQDSGGVWHNDNGAGKRNFIGATDVDGTTLPASGIPYSTTPVTWTVPDIAAARAYDVYAEWGVASDNGDFPHSFGNAYWPADDGIGFTDTFENDRHHTILSWNEYDSVDENYAVPTGAGTADRFVDTINGYSVVPGNATANQTDGGDSFTAEMQIVAPAEGIDTFGAEVKLYYEWRDNAGVWNRSAAPLDSETTPVSAVNMANLVALRDSNNGASGPHPADRLDDQTPVVELANYGFSGTLPTVGGTIRAARVVADVTATHDGDMLGDFTTSRPNGLDYRLTAFTGPDNQVVNGREVGSFLEGLNGGTVSLNVTVDTPDAAITDFTGQVTAYLEYHDGVTWQRVATPLDSEIRTAGNALTPLNYSLAAILPDIAGPVEQARIVGEFALSHDGIPQPTDSKILATWDGSSTAAQPTSTTTLISWGDPASNSPTTRREEFASKVETLNQPDGANRPLRLSNLGTSGLYGLNLAATDIDSFDNAKIAVERVQQALDQVIRLGGYYGGELKRVERMIALDELMRNTLDVGIGNLVDADMGRESALLQALQVKEQLGLQSLNIANNAKGLILNLFQR